MFSLRVQRCFPRWDVGRHPQQVFSACAEMFLHHGRGLLTSTRFLCVCRDVSVLHHGLKTIPLFSLRVQRCFQKDRLTPRLGRRFLCVCRDVSILDEDFAVSRGFSLRVQRCFPFLFFAPLSVSVFSACAEMFLSVRDMALGAGGFLCVCRDVSALTRGRVPRTPFSLRVQRCFSDTGFQLV